MIKKTLFFLIFLVISFFSLIYFNQSFVNDFDCIFKMKLFIWSDSPTYLSKMQEHGVGNRFELIKKVLLEKDSDFLEKFFGTDLLCHKYESDIDKMQEDTKDLFLLIKKHHGSRLCITEKGWFYITDKGGEYLFFGLQKELF